VGTAASAAPVAPQAPVLYDARCSVCGKDTKVPFVPDNKRPSYCKTCRTKLFKPKEEAPKEIEEEKPGLAAPEGLSVLPFGAPRRPAQEPPRPRRREINLSELKDALKESIDKKEEPPKDGEGGIIRPGETIKF
jgi:CxxC-x17-CxxC domain-containing protein